MARYIRWTFGLLAAVLVWAAVGGCADLHLAAGKVFLLAGNYPATLQQYQTAIEMDSVKRPGKIADECEEMTLIATMFRGRVAEITVLERALAVCEATKDLRGQAKILWLLGIEHQAYSDQREKSIECLERAAAIHRSLHDGPGEGADLTYIGFAYSAMGRYGKSLEYLEQASQVLKQHHGLNTTFWEVYSLNMQGRIYRELGQHEKAMQCFKASLAMQPFFFKAPIVGIFWAPVSPQTLMDQGGEYDFEGDHKKAIDNYKLARFGFQVLRFSEGQGWASRAIGVAYELQGRFSKALQYYRDSMAISGSSDTVAYMARTYERMGQHDKALQYYDESLSNMQRAKDLPGEPIPLCGLMEYWKARGKPSIAIIYGKEAVNIYQELRGNIQDLDRQIQRSYLTSHEDTYRTTAELLIQQGRLTEAAQILNMLKEEEYFDFIRRDSGEASSLAGRAALNPEEADWQKGHEQALANVAAVGNEYHELKLKHNHTPEEEQHLTALAHEVEDANRIYQAQLDELDTEAAGQDRIKDRIEIVRHAQSEMKTLGELGPGTVAVYTVVCDNKYHVILITEGAEIAREYPIKSAELNRKVMEFREALCNPNIDPRPLAQQLYQIIAAPIAKDLESAKAQTVMWSLDGGLRYLPIAALYDGQHYLVERYRNVVFTPTIESRLEAPVSSEWTGLGLGVSKAHGQFSALPGVEEELQGIIRQPGGTRLDAVVQGTLLMDEKFTADSMMGSLRKGFTLVHIASHFQFQPGDETNSFLLLGDGGHLTLASIKNLPNVFEGVELLTLSACDTAVGDQNANGKEVEGFAVLAQIQGADAVLATLWPVADQSTEMLMREFYRLREANPGMPKAEALRQAQLALLHGQVHGATLPASRGVKRTYTSGINDTPFPFNPDAPFAHPYYWAPFILFGNWK